VIQLGPRFARAVTRVVVRQPRLWALFRRPVARMFDRAAPEWDATRVRPQHLAPLEAALADVATPRTILDLGTGSGAAARYLAQRWPEASVTGVDVSRRMIDEAQGRATSDRERYVVGDGAALPFPDGSFDLVALVNMIPFFDELARVLVPRGTVVIAFSRGSTTPIFVPERRLRAELARRGFADFAGFAAGAGTALLAVKGDRP
jgi:ubiquinone/menaquinone biosynthesis C-methylase UbiE